MVLVYTCTPRGNCTNTVRVHHPIDNGIDRFVGDISWSNSARCRPSCIPRRRRRRRPQSPLVPRPRFLHGQSYLAAADISHSVILVGRSVSRPVGPPLVVTHAAKTRRLVIDRRAACSVRARGVHSGGIQAGMYRSVRRGLLVAGMETRRVQLRHERGDKEAVSPINRTRWRLDSHEPRRLMYLGFLCYVCQSVCTIFLAPRTGAFSWVFLNFLGEAICRLYMLQ